MKPYTIIVGVNGVGKFILAAVLRSDLTDLGSVIDVDKLTASLGGDKLAGGKAAIRKIESCLEKGVCFTQETTLSGQRTERTIRAAKEAGYQIRLYYVGLDSTQESLARIRNRVAKGGHNIPAEDVLRRFEKRFSDLARILPYCDTAVFYDNNNGFVEVAEYQNGQLLLKGSYRPQWIVDLAGYLEQL